MKAILNWQEAGFEQKATAVVLLVVVLVIIFVGTTWFLKEDYAVLFSEMQESDAANVLSELEKLKVPYRLEEGGTRILVPGKSVHETRLKLMGSGLSLSGGVGFEIFDESDFGMTEFAQRINYQRALQGELTRSIMTLDEVKYARVHLVMPENGLFKKDDSHPSASVILFLNRSKVPDEQQILGIQRLVAAAVPRLMPAQVMVTDQNGKTLSENADAGTAISAIAEKLQQKQAVENYLVEKGMVILDRTFGEGASAITVDVTLDFNEVKTTRENILPTDTEDRRGIVRKRESKTGEYGIGKQNGNNVSTEVEYQVGRSIAQIIEAPGRVVKISVAVLIPESVSEEHSKKISELVAVAIGVDQSRGDEIVLYPVARKQVDSKRIGLDLQTELVEELKKSTDGNAEGSSHANLAAIEKLAEYTLKNPIKSIIYTIFMIICLMFLAVWIFKSILRKPAVSTRLSEEEREDALRKVLQWLEDDDLVPAGNGD